MMQAALEATQALATSGEATLRAVAQGVGLEAARDALVKAYASAVKSPS